MKINRLISLAATSFVVLVSTTFSAPQDVVGARKITEIMIYNTYPTGTGGDVTVKLEGVTGSTNTSPGYFWISKSDGGYASTLSLLETAFSTGQKINLNFDTDPSARWPGTSGYVQKIYYISVVP